MQNEIKKVARIQLYDEPYDKAVPDTGIVFYNLDINTAVIEMEIIRKTIHYKLVMRMLIRMFIYKVLTKMVMNMERNSMLNI